MDLLVTFKPHNEHSLHTHSALSPSPKIVGLRPGEVALLQTMILAPFERDVEVLRLYGRVEFRVLVHDQGCDE